MPGMFKGIGNQAPRGKATMDKKITAIIGSYRKNCATDSIVSSILTPIEERGARVIKITKNRQ